MSGLNGKIYWVCDDFSYNGIYIPKKDETSHISTNLTNAIITDYMIKFSTEDVDYGDGIILGYNVNLNINDNGSGFSGTFTEVYHQSDWKGNVSCELFENKKVFFLYGKWMEDDKIFTWWARIDKNFNK